MYFYFLFWCNGVLFSFVFVFLHPYLTLKHISSHAPPADFLGTADVRDFVLGLILGWWLLRMC